MSTRLEALKRGDTFKYTFTIGGDWDADEFSALKFTIRTEPAATSVVTDTDAVAQATVANGMIVIDATDRKKGTVTIPAATTTTWAPRNYLFDLQATTVVTAEVYTLDDGILPVSADITRAP